MVRVIKNKNGDFISISTSLEIKDKGKNINVPVYVQVGVTRLREEDYSKVYKASYGLFNHTIKLDLTKPAKNEKPWWKKLFN